MSIVILLVRLVSDCWRAWADEHTEPAHCFAGLTVGVGGAAVPPEDPQPDTASRPVIATANAAVRALRAIPSPNPATTGLGGPGLVPLRADPSRDPLVQSDSTMRVAGELTQSG